MRSSSAMLGSISALTIFSLGGCAWVGGIVESEFSAYAEPADGPLAHVRLIGSRNVKVYPDSTCVGTGVAGSGYPAGPQMGGQRKRDIGMPKLTGTPRHFVEIATRSGEPLTMAFSFYGASYSGGYAGGTAPQQSSSHCYAAHSFVPETGGQYEAVADWSGGRCAVNVVRLEPESANGPWRRIPVPSIPALDCSSGVSAEAEGRARAPGN